MIFAMSVTHISSKYWQGNHNVLCDFFQPLGVLSMSPTVRHDLLCSYELSYEPLSMQKAEHQRCIYFEGTDGSKSKQKVSQETVCSD